MIILITGASHTGKTALAQRLLEKYKYPYLSIDHLKMGLIRSGYTALTPVSDAGMLTQYLWPVVREMIKTAIENGQNLVVEGCYIPFGWAGDFEKEYLEEIRFYCLVMTEKYIEHHFDDIRKFAGIVEDRGEDEGCTPETVRRENAWMLENCIRYGVEYIEIDDAYQVDIELGGEAMIRPVKKCEIETCVRVIRESFLTVANELGFTAENAPRFTAFATTAERLSRQFDEGRPMIAYFDGNGRITGYYSLHIQENGECELNNLCVLPECRHKRIGEMLFSHAAMTAEHYGCKKMKLGIVEENKKLRIWYEKLGAVHTGTEKFDFFPFTCGYMEKTIGGPMHT